MEIDFIINKGKHITGLSCYSSNLKKELSKMIKVKEIDTSRSIPKIILALGKFLPFDIKTFLSINPLFIPIRKNAIAHLTTPYFALALFFCRCKSVVTVHDLILFEHSRKDLFVGKKPLQFNKLILRLTLLALKKANRIIADSEYTKKRIIKMAGCPSSRISVIHLGVNKKEFRPLNIKKQPFAVLYVGSEMPRKNIPLLIKAFAKLKKRLPQAKLVKIGLPQWPGSRNKLKKLISNLGLSDSVFFKDYSNDLVMEYCKASLLVHPSIYEGFGLPVIEAMACGCPVICSNKTSLPEVAGDAAIYFDGHDVDGLAKKMYKVLTDKKLQSRLRKKGLKQAKKFTWEKTAEKTLEVYRRI